MAVDLQHGEEIIFEGHPSWRATLAFYIKGEFVAVAIGAAFAGATALLGGRAKIFEAILIAVAIAVLVLAVGFVKRYATTYTVTNRRLNIRRGLIARKVQETRLERVQNVNYSQSVLQRMLQVGDVDFDTAAGDDYNFIFAGVSEPEEVVERVDQATGISGGPKPL
ncbi:MAG: PH domain-containing protein [Thermoleophilaceae bacterium]|nr:PH domain-containing protein [Thermoleophilaceae bacterium]